MLTAHSCGERPAVRRSCAYVLRKEGSAVTPTLTPTKPAPPAGTDRCDRCGAPARVRVVLSGGDLVFCGHHARAYDATIQTVALEVVPSESPN
jgi:hypothetical protein